MSASAAAPLAGSTAVVTGGVTGIGLAITRRLLEDGARVHVAALHDDELAAVRAELADEGHDVDGTSGDLSTSEGSAALVRAATESLGGIDILVNNAGGGVIRPTLEHTERSLRATIDNNLWTTLRCCLAVLPDMRERGYGRIINIGAESVRNGLIDHAVYNAAKGGVHGLTTGLAREFATEGITANVVAPSYVVTPVIKAAVAAGKVTGRMGDVLDRAVGLIPVGRAGEPEEVAAAVAFLARRDSGFVTGQVLSVNGGSSMC